MIDMSGGLGLQLELVSQHTQTCILSLQLLGLPQSMVAGFCEHGLHDS